MKRRRLRSVETEIARVAAPAIQRPLVDAPRCTSDPSCIERVGFMADRWCWYCKKWAAENTFIESRD